MGEKKAAVLVTGYKAGELGIFSANHPGIRVIRHVLKRKIRDYAENGAVWFVISGQTGVELWAGEACLELRDRDHMRVKLAVLMPFLNQEAHYNEWQQAVYAKLLERADFTGCISKRPYENPEQLRQKNEFLVAKTDAMLIIYDDEAPGSPRYYLKAAERRARFEDYPIQAINRYDLDFAAEDFQLQNPDYWTETDRAGNKSS